ncbi:hypothetical protein ACVWXM_009981 [Bradyrhizobium sp. GM7.3]
MGEEKLQALLQESLSVAIKPSNVNRLIVDTTVQPKNVMMTTHAQLQPRPRDPDPAGKTAGPRLAAILSTSAQR